MNPAMNPPPPDADTRTVFNKFALYETKTRFYIVGYTQSEDYNRVLKIDRTVPDELHIVDDEVVYTKQEVQELISMIEQGNKSSGGFTKLATFYGIIGFVKFLEGYYISIITRRNAVALIGGHYIYHIDETSLLSIPGPAAKVERKSDEARYIQIFNQVDLNKNFYFSYTYDITQTLQHNLNVSQGKSPAHEHNEMFFAGARFLKRGTNDQGFVANDVETEQIVHDATTTSFYNPRGRYGRKASYTSFVQHRGSIPLFWSQDTSNMTPKPPIELTVIDPFFSAAALHFDNMFQRYGAPIIVLNLVKSREKTRRESILLDEFTQSVSYLNQFLPADKKIRYIAWDMARASKSNDQDVIGVLEDLAEEVLSTTGFFHSGPEPYVNALRRARAMGENTEVNRILGRRQNGVVRTNCIDCLDRTNAAQFVIGKCALGHQLYALGVLAHPSVPFDSDAINLLNAMYHDHGDTIALQYGGSHLVNTMETYRKISPWTSHSRDMIESIRRYYSNSFTDREKQDAMNLFLGHYMVEEEALPLWELSTDYYLHNENPRQRQPKRSYVRWYTSESLLRPDDRYNVHWLQTKVIDDGYFLNYYRPRLYTSFIHLFSYNMISTNTRNMITNKDENYDLSPFTIRTNPSQPIRYFMIYSLNIGGVKRWLTLTNKPIQLSDYTDRFSENDNRTTEKAKAKETDAPWWTTSALATRLLDPQVPSSELREYKRYVNQFRTTTLTSSSADSSSDGASSHPDYNLFSNYVSWPTEGAMDNKVDSRDEALYSAYATTMGKVSTYIGPNAKSRHDAPRYE
ncbi:phosphatidylinositol-3,5-bisphosphate 5-phosphatase, partial [Quaeritorhiza haematococci]